MTDQEIMNTFLKGVKGENGVGCGGAWGLSKQLAATELLGKKDMEQTRWGAKQRKSR